DPAGAGPDIAGTVRHFRREHESYGRAGLACADHAGDERDQRDAARDPDIAGLASERAERRQRFPKTADGTRRYLHGARDPKERSHFARTSAGNGERTRKRASPGAAGSAEFASGNAKAEAEPHCANQRPGIHLSADHREPAAKREPDKGGAVLAARHEYDGILRRYL